MHQAGWCECRFREEKLLRQPPVGIVHAVGFALKKLPEHCSMKLIWHGSLFRNILWRCRWCLELIEYSLCKIRCICVQRKKVLTEPSQEVLTVSWCMFLIHCCYLLKGDSRKGKKEIPESFQQMFCTQIKIACKSIKYFQTTMTIQNLAIWNSHLYLRIHLICTMTW
jgi:hypothetical protein